MEVDTNPPKVPDPQPNPPPPEETAHILADLHKVKDRNRELEEKLRKVEDEKLASSQQWETLAKNRETQIRDLETRLQSQTQAIVEDRKMSVVREAALRAGLRRDALEDLENTPLRGVIVETTSTGKINVLGADAFVQDLKTRKPFWFDSNNPPSVNPTPPTVIPGGGTGKPTVEELRALEAAARKTPANSPEWKKYAEAVNRFKAQ